MSTNDIFSTDYNPVLGSFINGAFINSSSNFVDNIGGLMDGQLDMILNAPSDGQYILTLTYLAYRSDRMMRLEVNGVDTGNVYVLVQTDSDIPADAKDFSITINLNAGDNTIKIHGNGTDNGPSIGNINLKKIMTLAEIPTLFSVGPTTLVTNYDAALGTLSNGAYVNTTTNFVDNIGGPMNGAVEVSLTVDKNGDYNLSFNYLAPYSNASLMVDVNGVTLNNSYFIFQTSGSGLESVQTFSMIVTLQAGNNTIKFYGNGIDIGPSIGTFTLNAVEPVTATVENTPTPVFSAAPTLLVTNYDAALGTLSNGAYVNTTTNFVDNIGGPIDGAVEIPLTVDKDGDYNLSLNYLAPYSNGSLVIDINNVVSQDVYFILQTTGDTVGDSKLFSIVVTLKAGTNIVKFHGNSVDIGPSIGTFTLNYVEPVTATVNNTPTPVFSAGPSSDLTNYDLALGNLFNGAVINNITNFVDNLGGMFDGSAEIPLSVTEGGQYNLSIRYLAPYDYTTLKIDVNGFDSGNSYFLPTTLGMAVEDAQVFNVIVNLISGNNLIKFHGDGMNKAPSIGTFMLNSIGTVTVVNTVDNTPTPVFSAGPTTLVTNYDAALGTLLNGATVNGISNFVDNIGGPTDGAVEVPLSVDKDGQYNLELKYLSPLDNSALKVDVNDVDSGNVYFILQTIGDTVDYAQSFSLAINLNAGSNKIKFHGNGVDIAPSIGTFNINFVQQISNEVISNPTPVFSAGPTTLVTNYDAALGTLLNGAVVNGTTNFVDNLGGGQDGAVEVPLSVDKDGQYNLELKYLSPLDNSALKADVNDVDSGNVYFIPQTVGSTLDYVQSFNISVDLKAGSNKIIFHGNGADRAPSIGIFNINFVQQISNEVISNPTPVFSAGPTTLVTNYDAALGTLSNESLINETTNFIDNLGGAKDAAVEVPLSVDKDGQYNLEIRYLSPFDNTILKIDVNGIDSGENYFVSKTAGDTLEYAQSFNVIINLKAGSNNIKFHGNGVDMAPSIGTFIITEITTGGDSSSVFATAPNDLVTDYDAALGVFSNGASVNTITNFVDNIGGPLDGSVEIPLTVNKEGQYNLEIKYLSPLDNSRLKIYINDVELGDVYFIQQTDGDSLDYVKTFNIVISLIVGVNKIKFHGDGVDIAPSIGTFIITPVGLVNNTSSVFSAGPTNLATDYTLVTDYDSTLGVLSNGAYVNIATNFVDNVGGADDGSVEIPLNVDKDGQYNLELKYLSSLDNSRLKIDINSVDSGKSYLLVQTAGDTLNDVQLYNVIVYLKAGINIVKFHGNGVDMAPSIGTFIISFMGTTPDNTPSVFSTASTTSTNYDVALGMASGKATIINSTTKMLDNIGGSQMGSSTLNVTVDNVGDYSIDINYLSPNGTSKLKIDINDIATTTVYSLTKTNGNSIANTQVFSTMLKLNTGTNKLKFYGDASNNGLSLGKFTIKPSTIVTIKVYDPTTASLSNGAIQSKITKFVDNIGGKIEGTVRIPIDVNDNGIYNLAINYLSSNGDSTMKIIINDITTVTVSPLVKTIGTASTSIKIANASVKLNKGNNIIKISGDKLTPAFSIGIFTLLLTTIVNEQIDTGISYKIATASLANGAIINKTTKFVENIGGKLKGTVEMTIDIPNSGPYYLDLNYLSPSANSSLKIDINNKNTGTIYYMQKTIGNTISDVKLYNTPLDLLSGKYKIKFYGDGTNIGPNLGDFSITPITIINKATIPIIPTSPLSKDYYVTNGIFSNGAFANQTTKFVENLGGQDDGTVEINTATIPVEGTYMLALKYLSPDSDSSLQISINDEDTGDSYTLAQTNSGNILDVALFSKIFTLSKGVNKILFHGNGSDDGPSFEKFTLTPIKVEKVSSKNTASIFSAVSSNSLITNYDTALGTLGNGAIINETTSFVDNIGGIQDGESEVILTVYDSGQYNLDLKYLSPYENTILKIIVNGVESEESYFIPQTAGDSIENARVFNTTINLTEGKNLIKFHGNKVDNGPSLSTFIISLLDKVNSTSSVFSTAPSITLVSDYDSSLGIISNYASIDDKTNFVYNIGGADDGTVEVVLSVENSGQYNLALQYLSPYDNTSLKIDINGFDSSNSYFIPKTTGDTMGDVQIFNEIIDLMSGNNVIKFHGNGVDKAPWIGKFTIEAINNVTNNISSTSGNSSVFSSAPSQALITDYEATLGVLSNGAVINEETNFVDNLGGTLDGAVIVTLIVDKEGVYSLDVGYLSVHGDSILKFDVNDIDSGNSYFIAATNVYDPENINVFNGKINLLAGTNTIKFHGNGINSAPSVGPFVITPLINESNILTMNYLSVSEKKKH